MPGGLTSRPSQPCRDYGEGEPSLRIGRSLSEAGRLLVVEPAFAGVRPGEDLPAPGHGGIVGLKAALERRHLTQQDAFRLGGQWAERPLLDAEPLGVDVDESNLVVGGGLDDGPAILVGDRLDQGLDRLGHAGLFAAEPLEADSRTGHGLAFGIFNPDLAVPGRPEHDADRLVSLWERPGEPQQAEPAARLHHP